MTYTAEQLFVTNKANVHAVRGLTIQAFAGMQNLVELNLAASKAVLGDSFGHVQAVLGAKDVRELLALQADLFLSGAEKSAAYGQNVFTIVTSTAAEFTKAVEAKLAEAQTAFGGLVEHLAKSAPAGTEAAMAAFNSAVNASQTVIESAQSSAKKAVEMSESNLTTVANQAVAAATKTAKKRK